MVYENWEVVASSSLSFCLVYSESISLLDCSLLDYDILIDLFNRESHVLIQVDFDKMMITKPTKIRIRRTYHSGLSLQYIVSPNLMQVHAKINSMQVSLVNLWLIYHSFIWIGQSSIDALSSV